MDTEKAHSKKKALVDLMERMDSLLVAFSGGVDSTFLLAVAREVLGAEVVAATAVSSTYTRREQKEATAFASTLGVEHLLFESHETALPEFSSNPPERCYHCKKSLALELHKIAKAKGISHIAHAANLDDLGDYRPGLRAAEEMGLTAPLVDAGLTKDEIRYLSKEMGLPTWDKPAMACLASRIPYGQAITEEKLRVIGEGEDFLSESGFRQFRVRHHGSMARIEVEPRDFAMILDRAMRERIVERFKRLGFLHITLDLEGYVAGSMNRELGNEIR
jgi:pyridinium-3,5-biscarboxylic acid mononucleotide sulfurtransferase